MFRSSEQFQKQFRWEVDRWVFRFRQRGTPVEVTELERDRLIARHVERSRIITRAWLAGVFAACFVVGIALRFEDRKNLIMACYFGMAVVLALGLHYWADQAVTLHLRKRLPIGEKLGFLGAWMMRAEVTPWPRLLLGYATILPAAYLILGLPADQFGKGERWVSGAVVLLVAVMLTFMVAIKLLVDWRERRRTAWRQALDEARDLRLD